MPEETQAFAAQAPTSAPGACLHHSLSATDLCLWSLYLLSSKGTKGPSLPTLHDKEHILVE